ncbi:hypothetical protein [Nocardia sp. NPDC127526]|uniref:hypothetical protein n=1 Tax=Nocardia sp. NPDC127526 TaxID=3345393 RepID=UPI00362E8740
MSIQQSLPVLVPGIPVALAGIVAAVRSSGVLGAIERILRNKNRTRVEVVREQARMASLSLAPGVELSHTLADGSSLTVRQTTVREDSEETEK